MKSEATRSSRIWRDWTVANSLGFALAFLSFIPGGIIADAFLPPDFRAALPEALDPSALPAWLDQQTYASFYRTNLIFHMIALPVFGVIVGALQGRVLAQHLRTVVPWVGVTALAFGSLLLFELVERHVVIGPHAGAVEPLMIALGGSSIAGALQWYVLRRQGIQATRWLSLWVLGAVLAIPCGIGVAVTLSLMQPAALPEPLSWAWDLIVFGAVFGAVVGAVSGSALRRAVSPP